MLERPEVIVMVTGGGVVVGVNETGHGMRALRWAAGEASARGTPLTVCHVGGQPPGDRPLLARAAALARQWCPDLVAVRAAARVGHVAEQLRAAAEGADLLVVGSRRRGRVAGLLLGSTGAGATRRPSCPTVVVPVPPAGRPGPFAGHVLVGVDGGPAGAGALEYGFAAAERYGVAVAAVHVCPLGSPDVYRDLDWDELHLEHRAPGWDVLETVVEAARQRHRSTRVKLVLHDGPPAAGLVRASAGARLLVVGSAGHGRLAGALVGSVSQALVAHARCPVAVVPPRLSRGAARGVEKATT